MHCGWRCGSLRCQVVCAYDETLQQKTMVKVTYKMSLAVERLNTFWALWIWQWHYFLHACFVKNVPCNCYHLSIVYDISISKLLGVKWPLVGSYTDLCWGYVLTFGGVIYRPLVGSYTDLWWGYVPTFGGVIYWPLAGLCADLWWGHILTFGGVMCWPLVGSYTDLWRGYVLTFGGVIYWPLAGLCCIRTRRGHSSSSRMRSLGQLGVSGSRGSVTCHIIQIINVNECGCTDIWSLWIFYSRRRSQVEKNISSFTEWKYLYYLMNEKHSFFILHNIKSICLSCIIEINNELEVFVQISKTDVGFGNNRGRRPRLLQNPNEVFDICTNTSNKLFISILS